MRIISLSLLTLLIAVGPEVTFGDVQLPVIFGDGMVLQRDATFLIWGWANPREEVTVSILGSSISVVADERGNWSASVGPFNAGGPHQMMVNATNQIVLRDIYIGDVWLASGQSNMTYPISYNGVEIDGAQEVLAGARYPKLRLFIVDRAPSLRPKSDVTSKGWHAAMPENVGEFSAIAYLFGLGLHKRYEIPIGVIESDWGGTFAEAWMSKRAIEGLPEFSRALQSLSLISPEAFDSYICKNRAWRSLHAKQDRGRAEDKNTWAQPDFNASTWPQVRVPLSKGSFDYILDGFDGVVWFRKEVLLPEMLVVPDLKLYLGWQSGSSEAFFNGVRIGESPSQIAPARSAPQVFVVDKRFVRRGRNVVVVRSVGHASPFHGATTEGKLSVVAGIHGTDEDVKIVAGTITIPLAGDWRYQTGPDLSDLPVSENISIGSVYPKTSVFPYPYPLSRSPTVLFNAMIRPLTQYRIKGVIWYQGEGNAMDNRAAQYRQIFPALINDWRRHWGYDLPFLFVQLPGYGPNQSEPSEYQWAELREAQAMSLRLPNTGMATTIDLGSETEIHPSNKQETARRLVLAASKVVYGDTVVASGPTFQSMQLEGGRVRVKYTHTGSGLVARGNHGTLTGFEIAAADNKFVWAKAAFDGADIIVSNDSIKNPRNVRYAWRNTPDGNLFNIEGLPAVPFRTDKPSEVISGEPGEPNDRRSMRSNDNSAMRKMDKVSCAISY